MRAVNEVAPARDGSEAYAHEFGAPLDPRKRTAEPDRLPTFALEASLRPPTRPS